MDGKGKSNIRQETFAMDAVKNMGKIYPNNKRYLIGYSKSGFGALHLLFKYPEQFTGCAVFDAPLALSSKDMFRYAGSINAFSSYSSTEFDELLALPPRISKYSSTSSGHRLWFGVKDSGHKNSMSAFLEKLQTSGITPCLRNYSKDTPHAWNAIWLEAALSYFEDGVCE